MIYTYEEHSIDKYGADVFHNYFGNIFVCTHRLKSLGEIKIFFIEKLNAYAVKNQSMVGNIFKMPPEKTITIGRGMKQSDSSRKLSNFITQERA